MKSIKYDNLVIAVGAKPITPFIKNIDANNMFIVNSKENAIDIINTITDNSKVLVIRSGLIGLEMVENIKNATNAKISIIEKADRVLKNLFDEKFSTLLEEIKRTTFNEITETAIVKAFSEMRDIDLALVNAHTVIKTNFR